MGGAGRGVLLREFEPKKSRKIANHFNNPQDIVNLMLQSVLIASILTLVSSQHIDISKQLVCVTGPLGKECYPKQFVPTSEWQVVRDGQEIPPGLHIKMNMDTLKKEAKLLDDEEDTTAAPFESTKGVDVYHDDVEEQADLIAEELMRNKIKQKVQEFKEKNGKAIPASSDKKISSQVQEAIAVLKLSTDNKSIISSLDVLDELSHDVKQGEALTSNPDFFSKLVTIAQGKPDPIVERVFRIMGSCLRNNPVATANVVKLMDERFFKALFAQILVSKHLDVIQKRCLGVIEALANEDHFVYNYFNLESNSKSIGIDSLILSFSELGPGSKVRLLHILEDLDYVPKAAEGASDPTEADIDSMVLSFLQRVLASKANLPAARCRIYLKALVTLHEKDRHRAVDPEFLQWISQKSEEGIDRKKRQESPSEQTELDEDILDVRHRVFGNPLARKSFGDEL